MLLSVLALALVTYSLVDVSSAAGQLTETLALFFTNTVFWVLLLLSLRSSGLARHWVRIADIATGGLVFLMAVLVLGSLANEQYTLTFGRPPGPVLPLLLTTLAGALVARRLLHHRQVKTATLLGSVAVYLLIPVFYFFAFLIVDAFQAGEFFQRREPTTSFMYFSLTNVSTLGYGDLVPSSTLGRFLAASEAIVGQVYLVTLVAMVVGLYAMSWAERARGRDGSPGDDPATRPAPEPPPDTVTDEADWPGGPAGR